ncbi:hypothetical protein BO94DRAFT_133555 [Aspergillus sclerotioniger CBS 115572]|uniref:Uncharacterized protein n=1 Tax=Aspergillus sclerotioniger CBS 115572 TaxID=1450535 RepID=A0A317XAR8_9EURO|nr:hypothetical protein BO94DRAFT_133555 [Aspergillus sclerotioniger CBS 115572]PWY95686.1 hypothetical protein BO94DRAFT_133555 [Aspergillus sclerotioniger CBS 115572]
MTITTTCLGGFVEFFFLSISGVKEIFLSVCLSFAFFFVLDEVDSPSRGRKKVLIGLKYSNGDASDPRHGRAVRSGEDPTAGGERSKSPLSTHQGQGPGAMKGRGIHQKERKREVRGKDGRPRW